MGIGRNGGIIGVSNAPTSSVASGIWTLNEVRDHVDNRTWPGVPQLTYGFNVDDADTGAGPGYTFNKAGNLGTAATGRLVVVFGYMTMGGGAEPTISGTPTINGVNADVIGTLWNDGSTEGFVWAIQAIVDTGTVGDISITFSRAGSRCGMASWSIYDLTDTAAPSGGALATGANSGATLDVNTLTNSVVLAYFGHVGGTTASWTGITERAENVTIESSVKMTYGDIQVSSASTPLAVSPTVASSTFAAGICAAWND